MLGRGELTDEDWERIEPMLPGNGRRGTQWSGHRTVIDGILWRLRTGAPWRDIPGGYGPWQTCYARFVRWGHDGTWVRILHALQAHADAVGHIDWDGRGRGPRLDPRQGAPWRHQGEARAGQGREKGALEDEWLGRSRGGLTTKIHLCADGTARPLSVVVTAGQRSDGTQLEPVLDAIQVPRLGKGRPGRESGRRRYGWTGRTERGRPDSRGAREADGHRSSTSRRTRDATWLR